MSDFSFRFIIIENGGHVSENYYRFVPAEPSPEGGFLVPGPHNRIDTSMTVNTLLDHMLKQNGGFLLLLCHGSPRHVSIPIDVGNKGSLDERFLDLVERLLPVANDAPRVDGMPETTGSERVAKIAAIENVLLKLGIRERFSDIQSANARFTQVVKQASLDFSQKADPKSIQAMWDFVKKVQQVQKIGYKRIEFRACRVGSNMSLMRKLRKFFNCNTLVAPKFRVMRAVQNNAIHLPARHAPEVNHYLSRFTPDKSLTFCRRCGVSRTPIGAHRLSSQIIRTPKHSGLDDHVVGDVATRRFSTSSGFSFDLSIRIINEAPSEFSIAIPPFNVVSSDPAFNILDLFEVFHRQFVYEDAVIAVQTIVLGGMWLGDPGGFVLANEPEYVANLTVVKR